jgi:hypothetical protein
MDVIIPVWKEDGVRACWKPGGRACPYLSYEGPQATCAAHDKTEYKGSPCWTYGNSEVDPDYAPKQGRPCTVGEYVRREGGLPLMNPTVLDPISVDELEDCGPWPEAE